MNDKSIKIGDIVKAEITGLQKYGAFVKFGKYRGLIHISLFPPYLPYIKVIDFLIFIICINCLRHNGTSSVWVAKTS